MITKISILTTLISHTTASTATERATLRNGPIYPDNPNVPQYVMSYIKGEIQSETYSLFKNLIGLEIEWSAINEFDSEAFKKIPRLEILDIHNNVEFPTLTSEILDNLDNLKVFKFKFNPYTIIEDGAFINLKNLDVLSISHQNMAKLTKEFLDGLLNLRELSLTNNEIETIEKDSFEHLTKLTDLYLENNFIKHFAFGTFRHQRNMVNLQIQSNRLGNELNQYSIDFKKFDKIINLKYLNIGDNNLSHIDVQRLITAFPKLTSINFMPNNLTCSNELYITTMLRRYRVDIEYYGNRVTNCKGLNFDKIGLTVFADL